MRTLPLLLILLSGSLAGRAQDTLQVNMVDAFPALTFDRPTDVQHDPTGWLYVVEQGGRILTFPNDTTAIQASVFLDLTDRVFSDFGELGLLGLAFDPDYTTNGYVYVDYTIGRPVFTRISRFTRSATDPTRADHDSEVVLMEVAQPYDGHNAGAIVFGPEDYLYVTLGDGGSGGDPHDNGENPGTLLGSILRLDVHGTGLPLDCARSAANNPSGTTFHGTVPPDNPFVGMAGQVCDEIFAYGLRNPWRISFDPVTGVLWAGDVGQFAWEEIDQIEAGRSYGWDSMEGTHCYEPPTGCSTAGRVLPVWEYGHPGGHCAVTGGYVYRGNVFPELEGRYIFGDFCSGTIWALSEDMPFTADSIATTDRFSLRTFGVDRDGELYTFGSNGRLRRLSSPRTNPPPDDGPGEGPPESPSLTLTGANPVRQSTTLRFAAEGNARLTVYDMLGREVAVLFDRAMNPDAPRTVTLNASDFAAGIYVARLVAGLRVETVTLAIVR